MKLANLGSSFCVFPFRAVADTVYSSKPYEENANIQPNDIVEEFENTTNNILQHDEELKTLGVNVVETLQSARQSGICANE